MKAEDEGTYARIYRAVKRVPRGRVATYGQIAELAGIPRGARQVGYALAALRDDSAGVPWHRVLNAKGEISARFEPGFDGLQRHLLEREGVRFDAAGKVSFERFRYRPEARDAPQPTVRPKGKAPKPKPKRARASGSAKTRRGSRGD